MNNLKLNASASWLFFALLALSACATNPGVKGYQKDELLSTANNQEQPEWANETRPFFVKSDTVYSVGVTQIKGDERPEAGMRIAENNARANIAKAITNRMEFIFQNAEENASYDSTAAKFIGSEVSTLTASSMKNEGAWWIRFAQSNEDGSRVIRYKLYSLIAMPEPEFKASVARAIAKASGQKKLSATFQKQVNRQWDRFIEAEHNTEVREPASKDE